MPRVSRIREGESERVRAAASWIARGSSSRRRQSSVIVGSTSSSTPAARARSTKSASPSLSASGGTGQTVSAWSCRRSRLVTSSWRVGQPATRSATSSAPSGRRCSRLSRSSSRFLSASARTSVAIGVSPGCSADVEGARDRGNHERRVAKRREWNPEDAVGVARRRRRRRPGARAASCRCRPAR